MKNKLKLIVSLISYFFAILFVYILVRNTELNLRIQIVTFVATFLGILIAWIQYKININYKRIEKAVSLSEYYKDNIIDKYSSLIYFYNHTKIKKIFDKNGLKYDSFDKDELKENFTENDIETLRSVENDKETLEVKKLIYSIHHNFSSLANNDVEVSIWFRRTIIDNLLNDLEFFSMNFTHGIADESAIYQSLSQTYVEMVEKLYYYISEYNDPDNKKPYYYTNTIELYLKWRCRQAKYRDKIFKQNRRVDRGNKG